MINDDDDSYVSMIIKIKLFQVQTMLLHLVSEISLQLFSALKVFGVGGVVDATVGEDSVHVGFEEMSSYVISKNKC